MKLHTVFITYNRLELTKRAIESYLETVTLQHRIVVADNGSTDGTVEWLEHETDLNLNLYGENFYPGKACNIAWDDFTDDTTHLHRADNDFMFLPGWCEEVERRFRNRNLGQLGLRTDAEELHAEHNVGGNCIIRRELWEAGLRYDERPWPQIRDEVGPGYTEDSFLSGQVEKMGWRWGRVRVPCIQPIGYESAEDSYYRETWAARGITPS